MLGANTFLVWLALDSSLDRVSKAWSAPQFLPAPSPVGLMADTGKVQGKIAMCESKVDDAWEHNDVSPRGRGPRGTQQCLTCDGGDYLHSSGAWVHGEKPHGTLDVSGDAAAAIAQSNEVPKNHRPQRVPRIGKYFRRHIKKPTRRLKPPKGKVIDGRHEQYTLSYTMQLGIQRSVEYAHSVVFSVCNSFVRLRTLALGTTRQL